MEQNYNDEIEIDLKELFIVLLNNWMKIALSAILVAAIFFGYSKFIVVPQYASTAKLYVLTKSTSITSLADIQTGTNLTKDYEVIINSRPVVEKVIKNLGLDLDYETMCEKLTVENMSDTRIISITIKDADPQLAKEIVDEFAEVVSDYIAEKMDQEAPSIIENGYVSNKKVSPSVMKNTFVGGMLGAIAAMGVVFVTFLMNDTIMTADDVEKYLGLNTLASIPVDENEAKLSKKNKKSSKKQTKAQPKKKR